jgi:hypothetical protein
MYSAPFAPFAPPRPKRSKVRIFVGLALAVFGLAAIAGGAVPIVLDLTREPTDAEIKAAGEKEIGARWRALTASQIFPARVDTKGHDGKLRDLDPPAWSAVRAGLAPEAACGKALDAPVAKVLARHGCRTVLRATYVDGSGTLAATIGIAVLADTRQAAQAEADLGSTLGVHGVKERYGVRVAEFPGTAAAGFEDSLRRDFWLDTNGTPYLFFRSSGWLADRGKVDQAQVLEQFYFARMVVDSAVKALGAQTGPCDRRGVRC